MKIKSVFTRMFLFFIVFTVILVGTLWVAQLHFLPDYYQKEKIAIMERYLERIEKEHIENEIGEEFSETIAEYSERFNGRVLIFENSGRVLLSSGSQILPRDMRILTESFKRASSIENQIFLSESARGNMNHLTIISASENYFYVLQTPFDAINDAIAISQGFYLYLLGIGLIIAVILSWFFARKISNPLIKLNVLAGHMAALDFGKKWDDSREDELGQLGQSLNLLTKNLEEAINNLQLELDKEKNLEKMRKEFVTRVSHELQTPIAIINGHIEALMDQIPENEEERNRYLGIIESETLKMSYLIKDLLDLSQMESGNYVIHSESTDYLDLLENRLDHFGVLIKEKGLDLEVAIETKDIFIFVDQQRIEQVINNLLQNAIIHSDSNGKIWVWISDDGDYVITEIYNQSERLSETELQQIWQPFYKKKEQKEGTGIGLAIVRNIIELHEGIYGARNEEHGITVFFKLKKIKDSRD